MLAAGLLAMACTSASEAAPSFVAETFHDGAYDLNATKGRPVVINFWFPSCPPCNAELPDLQAAYEKYGDQVDFIGVQQIGIDTKQDGIEFLQEKGVTYPNFADEKSSVQASYGILTFPTTVFLDRDHNIHREWQGLIGEGPLEEQIQAVIDS